MGQPYVTERRVEFHQTDAAGIMHFAQFYLWMEQAEHELLRTAGLSVFWQEGEHRISWPRVACRCEFSRPVRFEDVVTITVEVARISARTVTYRTSFLCHGLQVAHGEMTAVCCRVDADGLTAVPIPEPLRKVLEQHVVDTADG